MSDPQPSPSWPEGGGGGERLKPLHVQVAEALGWINVRVLGCLPMNPPVFCAKGKPPGNVLVGPLGDVDVPHYDTDWSATGPLVHARGIALLKLAPEEGEEWVAYIWDSVEEYTTVDENEDHLYLTIDGTTAIAALGDTPLLAACNLIVWQAKQAP